MGNRGFSRGVSRRIGAVASGFGFVLVVAALLAFGSAAVHTDAGVNPDCPAGTTGYKVDGNPLNGLAPGEQASFVVNGQTFTFTAVDSDTFDFTSTIAVSVVFVKGGLDTNEYDYAPPVTSGTGLHPPLNGGGQPPAISHVLFCAGVPSETTTTGGDTTTTIEGTTVSTGETTTTVETSTSGSTTSTTEGTTESTEGSTSTTIADSTSSSTDTTLGGQGSTESTTTLGNGVGAQGSTTTIADGGGGRLAFTGMASSGIALLGLALALGGGLLVVRNRRTHLT